MEPLPNCKYFNNCLISLADFVWELQLAIRSASKYLRVGQSNVCIKISRGHVLYSKESVWSVKRNILHLREGILQVRKTFSLCHYSTLDLKYLSSRIPVILLVKGWDFVYPQCSLCFRAGGLWSATTTFLPEHKRSVDLLRCHEPHQLW